MSGEDNIHRSKRARPRRHVLKTVGAVAASATVAGCTGGGDDMSTETDTSTETATDTSTETATATSPSSQLQTQLDTARAATEQYDTPQKAMEAGYRAIMGPYVPGMGWHLSNPEIAKDIKNNGFTVEKPNLLTYVKKDGKLTLGAVEWGAPAKALSEEPDLFADESATASESWHDHKTATHVFAIPDGQRTKPANVKPEDWLTNDHWAEFRPPDENLETGDTVSLNWGSLKAKEGETEERIVDFVITHPTLTTLHAWVHEENPEGVFNPVNPEFGEPGH